MSVTLREKKIKGGQISFYLDIYHNKARWYEFLDIHINSRKLSEEDKEKRQLASEIRANREHKLLVEDNGLVDKRKKNILFVPYYCEHYNVFDKDGKLTKGITTNYSSTVYNINLFMGKKPLPISRINAEWMKGFEKFLLGRVQANTALAYLFTVNTVLNEAVRKKIIPSNPWHDIPRHERLRKQDVFRTALTFEQLQMLAATSCKLDYQYRQAYFFACFTGLRWSDFNCLQWKEIVIKRIEGVERWFIYFEQEKTEEIEYLPLPEAAIDILKERKKEAEEHEEKSIYVFPRVKEVSETKKTTYGRFYYSLKKWARAAVKQWGGQFALTEKEMHPHNARHTFATNMLETGAQGDLMLVSKLLGHKSIQHTQKYAHVREQRKLNAVDAFPKLELKLPEQKETEQKETIPKKAA